jgi:hypothetical protein
MISIYQRSVPAHPTREDGPGRSYDLHRWVLQKRKDSGRGRGKESKDLMQREKRDDVGVVEGEDVNLQAKCEAGTCDQ